MYTIKVTATFSAAHNLRNYRGKCEHLHGHNWVVEAVFAFRSLDAEGMAIDFKDARGMLKGAIEDLDHAYLNEHASFRKVNPTSENIAKFIYDRIRKHDTHISAVSVWENEHSRATYSQK